MAFHQMFSEPFQTCLEAIQEDKKEIFFKKKKKAIFELRNMRMLLKDISAISTT